MKKFLSILTLSLGIFVSAQEEIKKDSAVADTVKHWSVLGKNSLMINQAAFSNWVGGGANNVGWLAGVDYNITYEKDKDLWENIITLNYGQNNTQGIGVRKTQDVINVSTNYGRKVSKRLGPVSSRSFQQGMKMETILKRRRYQILWLRVM
jgi:hypothetical protein